MVLFYYKTRDKLMWLRPLFLLICILLIGCQKFDNDTKTLTQCIEPLTWNGDKLTKKKLSTDNTRKCFGLKWSIPESYSPQNDNRQSGEVVKLNMPVEKIKGHEDLKTLNGETIHISITSSLHVKFDERKDNFKKAYGTISGLRQIKHLESSFEVFEEIKGSDSFHSFLLISKLKNGPFAQCLLKPNESIETTTHITPCRIYSRVNDLIDIEYSLNLLAVQNLALINAELTELINNLRIASEQSKAS